MKNILFLSLFILLVATSCRRVFGKKVTGSGNVTTETRQVTGFTSVDVSSNVDVYLSQDSSFSVRVETDDNIIRHIETHVEGGVLYIDIEKNFNPKASKDIRVHVSAPALTKVSASGACEIFCSERLTYAEGFSVKLSGASDGELDVKAPKVVANLTGAGKLKLKGETRDLEIKGTGSSDIEGFEMMAENVSVKITGAGNADVFASVSLDVNVTGSGRVKYRGSPSVSQKISGAGSIKKVP